MGVHPTMKKKKVVGCSVTRARSQQSQGGHRIYGHFKRNIMIHCKWGRSSYLSVALNFQASTRLGNNLMLLLKHELFKIAWLIGYYREFYCLGY